MALLRGVNVGGKNKLPMRELAELFAEAGCESVRTFIQSGNVVFTANPHIAGTLGSVIAAKIAERFGFRSPVILRTAQQLRDVVLNNPFPEEILHVMFLADLPSQEKVRALDHNRSSPDEFIVRGQEVYLWLPNGVAASKLTNAWFDSNLATMSTSRNWRTVTKLLEMMEDRG